MVDLGGFYYWGNWREIIETHRPCLELGWWTNRSTDVVAQEMLGGGHLDHSSNTMLATAMAGALYLFPETTWRHKRHGSHLRDGVAAVQRTDAMQSSLSKSNLASDTYMWSWLSLGLMLAPALQPNDAVLRSLNWSGFTFRMWGYLAQTWCQGSNINLPRLIQFPTVQYLHAVCMCQMVNLRLLWPYLNIYHFVGQIASQMHSVLNTSPNSEINDLSVAQPFCLIANSSPPKPHSYPVWSQVVTAVLWQLRSGRRRRNGA